MSHPEDYDRLSHAEQAELDRLYEDWRQAQRGARRRKSGASESIASIVRYLRRNKAAVITLTTGAFVTLGLRGIVGAEPVVAALAGLGATMGVGAAIAALRKALKPRVNRQGDQVGGLNLDATIDWSGFEKGDGA